MKWMLRILPAVLLFAALPAWPQNAMYLKGQGIPFMKAVYEKMMGVYQWQDSGLMASYAATGHHDALQHVHESSADFAVADFASSPGELESADMVQFPIAFTAVAITVNISGVRSNQLKLNGELLADIMEGRIKIWNAAPIRALNPGLALPATEIVRVIQTAQSGATLALTAYLSKYSKKFKKEVGDGLTVTWPREVQRADTAEEMAGMVASTPGAISYMPMDIGNRSGLAFVSLVHPTGSVVRSDITFLGNGVLTRTNGHDKRIGEQLIATDLGETWPIIAVTYILVRGTASDDERTRRMLRFFFWSFQQADTLLNDVGLVSLPPSVQAHAVSSFRKVRSKSGQALTVNYDIKI